MLFRSEKNQLSNAFALPQVSPEPKSPPEGKLKLKPLLRPREARKAAKPIASHLRKSNGLKRVVIILVHPFLRAASIEIFMVHLSFVDPSPPAPSPVLERYGLEEERQVLAPVEGRFEPSVYLLELYEFYRILLVIEKVGDQLV